MAPFAFGAASLSHALGAAARGLDLPQPVTTEGTTPAQPPIHDSLRAAHLAYQQAVDEVPGASFAIARRAYDAYLRLEGQPGVRRAEALYFAACCNQRTNTPATADFAESLRLLTAANIPAAEQPAWTSQLRPLLADCYARDGRYSDALALYRTVLAGEPPATVLALARQGLSNLAIRAARAGNAATQADARTTLWGHAITAVDLLRNGHAEAPVTATTIRAVAGLAYTDAQGSTDRSRWERARTLFGHLNVDGASPAHRLDARYYLGWCEFQLGNFSAARSHFDAFAAATTTDPRRTEVRAMSLLCQAEGASGPMRTEDSVRHYRAALSLLAGVERSPSGAPTWTTALTTRIARSLLPLMNPATEGSAFNESVGHIRTILGSNYATSGLDRVMYNRAQSLLYPASGTPTQADRDTARAFFQTVARDFPTARSGMLAAIEAAREGRDFPALERASTALLTSLGAPSDSTSAADLSLMTYATRHKVLAQLAQGNVTAALTTTNSALEASPATARQSLRSALYTTIVEHAEGLTGLPAPTADDRRNAARCFDFIQSQETTRGTLLRARSLFGSGRVLELGGDTPGALVHYRNVGLLYPASSGFTAQGYVQLRQRATTAIQTLEERR